MSLSELATELMHVACSTAGVLWKPGNGITRTGRGIVGAVIADTDLLVTVPALTCGDVVAVATGQKRNWLLFQVFLHPELS